jgi:hypothetical protein
MKTYKEMKENLSVYKAALGLPLSATYEDVNRRRRLPPRGWFVIWEAPEDRPTDTYEVPSLMPSYMVTLDAKAMPIMRDARNRCVQPY